MNNINSLLNTTNNNLPCQPIGKPSLRYQPLSFKNDTTDTFNSTSAIAPKKSVLKTMQEGYALLNFREVWQIIWEALTGKSNSVRKTNNINYAA